MKKAEGLSFSLGVGSNKNKNSKKKEKTKDTPKKHHHEWGFDDDDDDFHHNNTNHDSLSKEPLVIPLQKDTRSTLQAQQRQQKQQQQQIIVSVSKEDQAAIDALQKDAFISVPTNKDDVNDDEKLIIDASNDTFQRNKKKGKTKTDSNKEEENDDDDEDKQFRNELNLLPDDPSVESHVYRQVPISEFGAAMLRGMGWTGGDDNDKKNKNDDDMLMPRPSRLGLGATPKLLWNDDDDDDTTDNGLLATHSRSRPRRPRRQDQVQREERLKRQQQQYQQERNKQIAMDKQQTLQIGSIVRVDTSTNNMDDINIINNNNNNNNNNNEKAIGRHPHQQQLKRRRARIEKVSGVPGLNMILVVFERESQPTKVKKGSVTLVERSELIDDPFEEGPIDQKEEKEVIKKEEGDDSTLQDQQQRRTSRRRDNHNDNHKRDRKRERSLHHEDEDDNPNRRDKSSNRYSSTLSSSKKYKKESSSSSTTTTTDPSAASTMSWLIPSIRVRVVSRKYGDRHYKQKGTVVDVVRKGMATLSMDDGRQVITVAERHLETALPKVGGNTCILAGQHRLAKGRLLERDSKANKGAVQLFEDMSIVTTSLDDMAEWCGPLDDDDLDDSQF
ncbi:G-patch domain containing protein [Nitzschia inconspicua]|uniref:G-patch domain containing protein n=1 Tax=Nitzschia inconspicua TaxID=303405 RepID=A0A9K3PBH3_9STRA|nr:G-patch domain containing protein [Nitzschia inconspicua]